MPTRSTSKKSTGRKTATKRLSPQAKAARTRKRNAAKRAAERREAAEATAAHYAPAPIETVADPSKAPGKQHRHPPLNVAGVKHSEAFISKARTPFNRRINIGR